MKTNERIGLRVTLLTLAALVVPMIVFPAQFGMQLARGSSLVNILYELVWYAVAIFLLYRRGGLLQLVPAAGVCLVYRLVLGSVLGLMISGMYSMGLKVSITLAVFSYLPAVLFHIAVTPFILKPVVNRFYRRVPSGTTIVKTPVSDTTMSAAGEATTEPIVPRRDSRPISDQPAASIYDSPRQKTVETSPAERQKGSLIGDLNGFERAVRYIGEHASVHLAAVVDYEGLLLANYKRGEIDSEEWAPLAGLFFEGNRRVLEKRDLGTPEKLDLLLQDKRVIIARDNNCDLLVVAERQSDDVLSIRINQALEMIRKYMAERYGNELNPSAERINVSSTE